MYSLATNVKRLSTSKDLVASVKRLHNYGQPPFLLGKSTINGKFSIAMLVYQRVKGVLLFVLFRA
jgi:hypothetical protein